MKWTVSLCVPLLLLMSACGGGNAAAPNQPSVPAQNAAVAGNWELLTVSNSNCVCTPESCPGDGCTLAQLNQLLEMDLGAGFGSDDVGETQFGYTVENSTIAEGNCDVQVQPAIGLTISGNEATFQDIPPPPSSEVAFTWRGVLTNNNLVTGTYSLPAPCADQGTFTGTKVPQVSGSYSGTYDGANVTVVFTTVDNRLCSSAAFSGGMNGTDECSQWGAWLELNGQIGLPVGSSTGSSSWTNGWVVTAANAQLFTDTTLGPISVGDIVLLDHIENSFTPNTTINGVLHPVAQ